MDNEKKYRKVHTPGALGKGLNRLPKIKLLYPLYAAAQLKRSELTISKAQLPKALQGFRIAFAADIHCGEYLDEKRAQDLMLSLNATKPHVILFGGDFAQDSASAVRFFETIQPELHAPYGVYAVPGNHDLTDPMMYDHIRDSAEKCHIRFLRNEVITLDVSGSRLMIAGCDDYYNGTPDLQLLEKQKEADSAYTILLSHSPDVLPGYFETHDTAWFDLFLCGHTHGGQIAVCGRAIRSSSDFGNRYNMGHKKEGGADILITMGVGTSMFPVRLGTTPEYHIITLMNQ